jgi:hypothetical protein
VDVLLEVVEQAEDAAAAVEGEEVVEVVAAAVVVVVAEEAEAEAANRCSLLLTCMPCIIADLGLALLVLAKFVLMSACCAITLTAYCFLVPCTYIPHTNRRLLSCQRHCMKDAYRHLQVGNQCTIFSMDPPILVYIKSEKWKRS